MAVEPINVFSRRVDPAGVLEVLRRFDPSLRVDGSGADWSEATITVKLGFFRKGSLTIRHNPDYYAGDDWPQQVAGMQGYFYRFPDVPRKSEILRLIGTFRFSLATDFQPEMNPDGDARLECVYGIAKHLDGVLFMPSMLIDCEGRILIAADGDSDPEAVLPEIPPDAQSPDMSLFEEDGDEDDEDFESDPPAPQQVARRALALAAVAARGLLEHTDPAEADLEERRRRLLEWVDGLQIHDELEPDEWKALQRPVGKLDRQAAINAVWRLESLGVLAWSLGRFDLPPYDQLVNPDELLGAVGFLSAEEARDLLAAPQLRAAGELAELQKRCLGIHWRLRDFTLRPQAMDYADFAKTCWFGPWELDDVRLVDGDLALGEHAVADAPEEVFASVGSAIQERHKAINWLCWGGVFSEVDTST